MVKELCMCVYKQYPYPTHIHTYLTPTHPHPPLAAGGLAIPLLLLLGTTFLFKYQESMDSILISPVSHNQYTVSSLTNCNWQLLPAHVYKFEVTYGYSGHTPRQGKSK